MEFLRVQVTYRKVIVPQMFFNFLNSNRILHECVFFFSPQLRIIPNTLETIPTDGPTNGDMAVRVHMTEMS